MVREGPETKFTARGSVEVELTGRPLKAGRLELVVTVRDTGPGMSAEVAGHLFTDYFQRNPLRSPATASSGQCVTSSASGFGSSQRSMAPSRPAASTR